MKRTLLVTIDYPPRTGGVAQYWKQVSASLSDEPFFILTTPDKAQEGENIIRKPLFSRLLWPRWLKGVLTTWRVYRQKQCEQILVGQVLPVGTMVWLLSLVTGIPYSVQLYGMDLLQAKKTRRKTWLVRNILKRAKIIFVNSNAIGEVCRDILEQDRGYEVIYPVPPEPAYPNKEEQNALVQKHGLEGKNVILTVTRLVPRKGIDKALGAMLHVWQRFPDTVFVIIGEGPEKSRLEEMALPHQDKVLFLGNADEAQKRAWYDLADVFVLPSRRFADDIEGFGIVFLEANWMATPVIGGATGGVKEAVKGGETGLLVDPEDIDDIAAAIQKLLANPEYAQKLGRQGRERLERWLNWGGSMKKLKELLS